MSDRIEIGASKSRVRRVIEGVAGVIALTGTVGVLGVGYKANHHASPSATDEPTARRVAPKVVLPIRNAGQLVFIKQGSYFEIITNYKNFQEVESRRRAEVSFDNLHCEDNTLHGGMVANVWKPLTAYLIGDMELPQGVLSANHESLSARCQSGQQLDIANSGKLILAGYAYHYELSDPEPTASSPGTGQYTMPFPSQPAPASPGR